MRIGTIGTGSIVVSMIESFHKTDFFKCEAVYSRKVETGRKLADSFGIQKVYTDLDEMCQDKDIDMIYVASPNTFHYIQAKKALEYGKHVICEKPFTITLEETLDLIHIAKENHLFLFEAITTAHHPNFKKAVEHLSDIGRLQMISAVFCQYSSKYDAFLEGKNPNVFNPEFAGGSLMDINFYNLYFVLELLGKPNSIQYLAGRAENGIDTHGILTLQYPDVICQCTGSKSSTAENGVQIIGEKGYIHVTPSASNPKEIRIVRKGHDDIIYSLPENPWYYETQAIAAIASAGDYETCYKRLDQTALVIEILIEARKSAGLLF